MEGAMIMSKERVRRRGKQRRFSNWHVHAERPHAPALGKRTLSSLPALGCLIALLGSALFASSASAARHAGSSRRSAVALELVQSSLAPQEQGVVAVRTKKAGICSLALSGPRGVRNGPYPVALQANYGVWSWEVPANVSAGRWSAVVSCVLGREHKSLHWQIEASATQANRGRLVAPGSMRVTATSVRPDAEGEGMTLGTTGKGGGGYPDDGALCAHTGARNGRCSDYDWGYRLSNGSWKLLSGRGFAYRNCTDFVAWDLGLAWSSFRFPAGKGNAVDWRAYAGNAGLRVSSAASVGDIAWWGGEVGGGFGHVAVVIAVAGDGSTTVAEYNHDAAGDFDTRGGVRADAYLHRPAPAGATPPSAPPPAPATPPATPTSPPPMTGGGNTPPSPAPVPVAAPTWSEQETPNHPVNAFTNFHNASGVGPAVGSGQWVQVSCKVYDPTIASVNPDGYWYRIASPPWNNAYYSPANTFMNGDPYGGPYTHNTDFAVPNC
jgi:surface antigen